MRAIGYNTPLPIEQDNSLVDVDLARPSPSGRDLLVEIKAISANPADTPTRRPRGGTSVR
jgi:NADPH2:quinone reductase